MRADTRRDLVLVAAADEDWGIGRDGDQLLYLREDLKRFKALTLGRGVILGRKTLATFPGGRPLPGRRNLILSRNPSFHPKGAEVFHTLEELLAAAPEGARVIGGGEVYRTLLPWCGTAYVTRIQGRFPADTRLPNLDADPGWARVEESEPLEQDGVQYRYVTYRRRNSGVLG